MTIFLMCYKLLKKKKKHYTFLTLVSNVFIIRSDCIDKNLSVTNTVSSKI